MKSYQKKAMRLKNKSKKRRENKCAKVSEEFVVMENKSTGQKVYAKAVYANKEWRFVIKTPLPLGVSMNMVNESLKTMKLKIN